MFLLSKYNFKGRCNNNNNLNKIIYFEILINKINK